MAPIQRTRGFTLIELLVVISIVSFLASVVIAATSSAKAKGSDARAISQVRQIQTSLNLSLQDGNTFPNPGSANTWYCLGKTSSQSCTFWGDTTLHGSDVVQNSLSGSLRNNIPSTPVVVNGQLFDGYVYKCKSIVNGVCNAAIYWAQSPKTPCIIGKEVMLDANSGSKICGQDAGGMGTDNVETVALNTSDDASTPFEFSLTKPANVIIVIRRTAQVSTSISTLSVPEPVTLSINGYIDPAFTVTFINNSCTPNCTITISVTAANQMLSPNSYNPLSNSCIQTMITPLLAVSESGVSVSTTLTISAIGMVPACYP